MHCKNIITYDQYDELCEQVAYLMDNGLKMEWNVTEDEIEAMKTSDDLIPYIGLIVAYIEDPEAEGTKKKTWAKLNSLIVQKINFTEKPVEGDVKQYSFMAYDDMVQFAEKADVSFNGWLPDTEFIHDVMRKNPDVWLEFSMMILAKTNTRGKNERRKALREFVNANMPIDTDGKKITVTKKSLQSLNDKLKLIQVSNDGWWPTTEEIELFIKPNMEKCFDFVLWLLSDEHRAKTPEQQESKRLLKTLVQDNVAIKGGDDVKWL